MTVAASVAVTDDRGRVRFDPAPDPDPDPDDRNAILRAGTRAPQEVLRFLGVVVRASRPQDRSADLDTATVIGYRC